MMTEWWKNPTGEHNYVKDPTSGIGMGPRERLAKENNETFKSHNGSYPDRPYSPYGTYSTGK